MNMPYVPPLANIVQEIQVYLHSSIATVTKNQDNCGYSKGSSGGKNFVYALKCDGVLSLT